MRSIISIIGRCLTSDMRQFPSGVQGLSFSSHKLEGLPSVHSYRSAVLLFTLRQSRSESQAPELVDIKIHKANQNATRRLPKHSKFQKSNKAGIPKTNTLNS